MPEAVIVSAARSPIGRAPTHVAGVRAHLVDLASDTDFAALGRVFDAVSDSLVSAHPEMEIRG